MLTGARCLDGRSADGQGAVPQGVAGGPAHPSERRGTVGDVGGGWAGKHVAWTGAGAL